MIPTEDKGCPSNFIMSKKGSKEQKFSKCSIQDIRKEIDSVRTKEQNKLRRCVSKLPEKTSNIFPCEQSLCLKTIKKWKSYLFQCPQVGCLMYIS